MLFDLKNDMEEIWKTVKGYNGYYQVSNTGKVRNPNKREFEIKINIFHL